MALIDLFDSGEVIWSVRSHVTDDIRLYQLMTILEDSGLAKRLYGPWNPHQVMYYYIFYPTIQGAILASLLKHDRAQHHEARFFLG